MTHQAKTSSLHPIPPRKRWNYWGISFVVLLFSSLSLAIMLVAYSFLPVIANFIRVSLEINEFYVGKLAAFFLFFCSAVLLTIIMMLDGEEKRLRKFVGKYTSKLMVKDYYQDGEQEEKNAGDKSGTESMREAASVRPKAVAVEEDYKLGKIDGTFKEFYPNGNLKREVRYLGGKLVGLFRTFYDNGQLEQEAVYMGGEMEGTYRSYYPDGTLHQQKEYSRGKLNGVYKANDERGVPFFEISYQDGVQEGPDKIYDHKGVLQFIDTYKMGICINRKTYDEYGLLKFDQDFEDAIAQVEKVTGEEIARERESQEQEKRKNQN